LLVLQIAASIPRQLLHADADVFSLVEDINIRSPTISYLPRTKHFVSLEQAIRRRIIAERLRLVRETGT